MLKQGHLEVVARVMSSCVFSKDGEPTNYLPGQSVSMLSHPCSKNGFLMFRGNLCFCLCPLPLALSLVTRAFSLHPSFRHLYTLMRSLWVFFSPRWTVPALPDMLQYLSPSQWSFARIHTVVSFLPLRGNTSLPFPVPEMPMPPSQAKCSNHYWGTKSPHADMQVMASSSGGQSREVTWAWLQEVAADKGAYSWAHQCHHPGLSSVRLADL